MTEKSATSAEMHEKESRAKGERTDQVGKKDRTENKGKEEYKTKKE